MKTEKERESMMVKKKKRRRRRKRKRKKRKRKEKKKMGRNSHHEVPAPENPLVTLKMQTVKQRRKVGFYRSTFAQLHNHHHHHHHHHLLLLQLPPRYPTLLSHRYQAPSVHHKR